MDNLEQFIKNNRKKLDEYDPSPNIWKGIRSGLKTTKSSLYIWFNIAAMFVIIIGIAAVLFTVNQKKNIINSAENAPATSNKLILRETEAYYNTLVNNLYHEATPLLTSHPEIAEELKTDMSQLDSICADIKKDLKDNVANQEVIEALIQNYRIKLQLLQEMLNLLKQNDNDRGKNKSHEL